MPSPGAPMRRHYDAPMSPRPRSVTQRIRDQIGFSLVAVLVLFVLLRFVGVRSTFASFALSVIATVVLNVGLSYYYEHRARRAPARAPRADADIRWREEERDRRG